MYKRDMKPVAVVLIILAFVGTFSSSPINTQEDSAVIFNTKNIANGEYSFNFITSDETQREESGSFDGENNYVVIGSYSYTDSSGAKYIVRYTADKNGFHPTIEHDDDLEEDLFFSPPQIVAALLG